MDMAMSWILQSESSWSQPATSPSLATGAHQALSNADLSDRLEMLAFMLTSWSR
jgi:hypothetical protein